MVRVEVTLAAEGPSGDGVLVLPEPLPVLLADACHDGTLRVRSLQRLTRSGPVSAQWLDRGDAGVLLAGAPVAGGEKVRLRAELTAGGVGNAAATVRVTAGEKRLEIRVGPAVWAVYRFDTRDPDLPRPYFHPILGPTGAEMTQDGEFPGTRTGHIWHTGLFLGHQSFTEGNNWQTGSPRFSRMVHRGFPRLFGGPRAGGFVQLLDWPTVSGDRVVFREERSVTAVVPDEASPWRARYLDVETRITCGERAAVWNPTPYHLLALRIPDALRPQAGGRIVNSEGERDAATAGRPARWLDVSGALAGPCGVTLLDHPENPRHPTPWLNFENETLGAAPGYHQPLQWTPGQSRTFRYRVAFHSAPASGPAPEDRWREWARPATGRVDSIRREG